MPISPEDESDRPATEDAADVLSSALTSLRISGNVVLHHTYGAPWAVDVPASNALAPLFGVGSDARIVVFHLVERGEVVMEHGGDTVPIGPGGIVACFGGGGHRLRRGRARALKLADVLAGTVPVPEPTGRPDDTRLLCGAFVLRDIALHPLLAAVPAVLSANALDDDLAVVTGLMARELGRGRPGSGFLLDRALEMLCASLLRAHLARSDVGWFRALREPRLARALERIHRAPGEGWTVDELARVAGLSRSHFAEQFTELVGESPMAYVTRWRMGEACRALRHTERSIAEIATDLGYASPPSFARVFRRHVGVPPAEWRRDHPPVSLLAT
ncbi:MAG: AraC family transcriptional regulator [Alphaproteobacteria bacterium]|nr:AraC family transcriptional regulator [Alphaproteobacteria bacterium]